MRDEIFMDGLVFSYVMCRLNKRCVVGVSCSSVAVFETIKPEERNDNIVTIKPQERTAER